MENICWKIEDLVDFIYSDNNVYISNYWEGKIINYYIQKNDNKGLTNFLFDRFLIKK